MPTPPQNPAPAVEQFSELLGRLRESGEIVANLDAPRRYRSKQELKRVRAKGRCEFPGCEELRHKFFNQPAEVDPHHVKTQGAGGGDRAAGPKGSGQRGNVVGLCRVHHRMAHDGTLPLEFFAWIADLED
jgi:hypothetical protein